MNLVKINPAEFGIEETKAEQMTADLTPIFAERNILATLYADVIVKELNAATIKEARELRLKIRDNRTKGVERWHKANKEFYLAGGRFVDAIKNKEVAENIRMEDALQQIENHFENLEKQRIADLQKEREALLAPYNVENAAALNLGTMPDDIWDGFIIGQKVRFEQKQEEARLAREAEEARIEAERAEREKVRIENERLKAEKEAAEKAQWELSQNLKKQAVQFLLQNGYKHSDGGFSATDYQHFIGENHYGFFDTEKELEQFKSSVIQQVSLQAERARVAAEKKAADDALADERKKAADALAAERETARIEREAAEKERARLADELKEKQDAEAAKERARVAEDERQRKEAIKAAKAPVKQKLHTWVDGFVMGAPIGMNDHATVVEILNKFSAFKTWAKTQIEQL
jgi:hypothetical protein